MGGAYDEAARTALTCTSQDYAQHGSHKRISSPRGRGRGEWVWLQFRGLRARPSLFKFLDPPLVKENSNELGNLPGVNL